MSSTVSSGAEDNSTMSAAHTHRTSRSLQYDQYHTQFYDPMVTAYQHVDHTASWESSLSVANESSFESETELQTSDSAAAAVDSLIVICTLFVPLAIAISAILIIALLIRRMRRAESRREMDDEEKCTGPRSPISHYYSQEISTSTEDISTKTSSQQQLAPSFLLNNKKSIPLPIILGLVDPDDPSTTTAAVLEPSSAVVHDEVSGQQRRGSAASVASTFSTNATEVSRSGRPQTQSMSIPCNGSGGGSGNYHNNVVDSINSIHKMSSSNNSLNYPSSGGAGISPSPSKSSFSDRVLNVLQFPKRMKEQQAEKKRFNIYNISVETREQLKQIYVY